jgi:hypothetical protein
MKNDLLKAALWVFGIIVVAYLIGKAIVDGMKISADGQLAAVKAEHEHQEKMFNRVIALHQKVFGTSHCYFSSPHDDFKPNV